MRKFNINDYMYIQITENGWEHLRKTLRADYIEYCINTRMVTINNETWYRLQCHEAFDLLPIKFGYEPLFSPNVMFDDPEIELCKPPEDNTPSKNEIIFMFTRTNKQRQIIEKIMPGTFDEKLSDHENCVRFLRKIIKDESYQELLDELLKEKV